jgi:hypothetical protein
MVKECTHTCSIRERYVPKPCIALYLVVALQIRSAYEYYEGCISFTGWCASLVRTELP